MKRLIFRLNGAAKKNCVFLAALAVCAALSSCSDYLARAENASLALPAWPPYDDAAFSQIELDRWEIRWRSGADSGAFDVPASARSVSLNLDANLPCAVLAQPVTKHGETPLRFFMPAGAVFPAADKLTWEDGFTADLCMELCETSPDARDAAIRLSQFNWGKFSEEIVKKAARKPSKTNPSTRALYNPWYADKDAVREGIIAGIDTQKFAASSLLSISEKKKEVANNKIIETLEVKDAQLIPQYVPLYAAQNEHSKMILKYEDDVHFLIVKNNDAPLRKIACVTARKELNSKGKPTTKYSVEIIDLADAPQHLQP